MAESPAAGATLNVMDGSAVVELVLPEAETCDGKAEPCQQAWLELDDPWARQFQMIGLDGLPDGVMLDDITLLPYRIGSLGALPLPAPARFEVRYFNALCPKGEDADYVTVTPVTSRADDPVAQAPFAPKIEDWARRVVSVALEGRTVHFVHASDIRLPKSRRMADLPPTHTEAFWIVLETASGLRVLEEREQRSQRSINHDHACGLPIQFPVPFAAVARDRDIVLFAAAGLDTYLRLRLRGETVTEEARFLLGIPFELF